MVYVVTHGDIAAVVSRTPVFIFDPTRENALAHEHVIETVMKTPHHHSHELRHCLPYRRRHSRSAAQHLSLGQRRAEADGRQSGVRAEGHLGPRPHHRGAAARARGDPPLPPGDHAQAPAIDLFRPHAAGPHDRQGSGRALGGIRSRDLRDRCAPSAWPRATTSRLATR